MSQSISRALAGCLSTVLMLGVGCATYAGAQSPARCMKSARFSDCYALRDSIVLFQDERNLIVKISSPVIAPNGGIVLADASEANVKVYGAHGALLHSLGRKGGGPGEFNEPSRIGFDQSGRLYVLDTKALQITIFDSQYKFVRSIGIRQAGYFTAVQPGPGGSFLVGGLTNKAAGSVFRIDSAGGVPTKLLDLSRVLRGDDETWGVLTSVVMASTGHEALVVSSVKDSIYRIDLRTGLVSSLVIPAPELKTQPAPPQPPDDKTFVRWARSFYRPSGIHVDGGEIFVTLTRGTLYDRPTTILAIMAPDGHWHTLSDAPAIVSVSHGQVLAILNPDAEHVVFGIFDRIR